MLRLTLPVLALAGSAALADDYARPLGVTPPAEDLGHVFFAVCHPTIPPLLEDRIVLAETAFGWDAVDLGTDMAFQTADEAVTVTLDGNVLEAVCEMTISKEVGGDGAALYEDLEAHLSEDVDGDLPEADYTDGGLTWSWERDVPMSLSYTETDEHFLITLTAGGF